MHGKHRVAEREAGNDVGAPGDAREVHAGLHVARDVVVAVSPRAGCRWRGSCAAHARSCVTAGFSACFSESARYCALMPNTFTRSSAAIVQSASGVRTRHRRTVVEHDRRAARQRAREPVPHHPPARGEIEDPIAGTDGGVKLVFLQVLQQRAARAVHEALRKAGRARREHHVERMVERQTFEAKRNAVAARGEARPRLPAPRIPARSPASSDSRRNGTTTTRSMDGIASHDRRARGRASRSPCRRTDSRPRRTAPAARSGRSGRARPPRRNPENTTTTPRRTTRSASIAITASGILGRNPATRSPARTPAARSAPATRATSVGERVAAQLATRTALIAEYHAPAWRRAGAADSRRSSAAPPRTTCGPSAGSGGRHAVESLDDRVPRLASGPGVGNDTGESPYARPRRGRGSCRTTRARPRTERRPPARSDRLREPLGGTGA